MTNEQRRAVPAAVVLLIVAACRGGAHDGDDGAPAAVTEGGACSSATDTSLAGTNLVPNGDFESDVKGWEGWNSTLARAGGGHCSAHAARVTASAATFSIDDAPATVLQPRAGKYRAEVWVRGEGARGSAQLVLRERTASDGVEQSRGADVRLTGDWQRLAVERDVTAGSRSLEVYVAATDGASFLVDDVRLVGPGGAGPAPTPAPTPPQGSPGGLFKVAEPWTKDVSALPKSPESDAITRWLDDAGGWGTGKMRIDFTIEVLTKTAATPFRRFTKTDDFFAPDCDDVPFPVPPGGNLEGEKGYECTTDGDCHLIVVDREANRLYEMWRANLTGGTFYGGCAAVWNLTRPYPVNLRGDGCTSADAGGFPVAAMVFSADEIAAGEIAHAIRFILPNRRIRAGTYVHPGTHTTRPTSGGPNAPPYGVRMRLRADYPVEKLPKGARVVARALQKYGMFLADGGDIALTAQSDRFTEHKWSEVGVDSFSLTAIEPTDMEVVDMGEPRTTLDCRRNFTSADP